MYDHFCNNCGKQGHYFHQCKMPIMSCGLIAFTVLNTGSIQYLMICRKHTLGFMDFMIGKYSIQDHEYIVQMLSQMTRHEKQRLLMEDFSSLWQSLWGNHAHGYKNEETASRDKLHQLRSLVARPWSSDNTVVNDSSHTESLLSILMKQCQNHWDEPEWGFPKGRKNNHEKDFECAMREFREETGYSTDSIDTVENLLPVEEIFIGSNNKSYKHKYFVVYMPSEKYMLDSLDHHQELKTYQNDEVSQVTWKSYEECMTSIRDYNLEKRQVLTKVNAIVTSQMLFKKV
jgi:8-oxo-dGTP pyrophosphatase MutT (NUDIX family)